MNPVLGILIMLAIFSSASAIILGAIYVARRQFDRFDDTEESKN